MSNAIRVIVLAVVVSITAIFLTFGFYAFRLAQLGMLDYDGVVNNIFGNTTGPSFAQYDQRTVDGEFVRNCMEKFGGKYFIRVRTSENPVSFCVLDKPINSQIIWEDADIGTEAMSITAPGSMCYVPSEEKFDVTVLKEDDEVYGVYFEQQNIGSTKGSLVYRQKGYSSNFKNACDTKIEKLKTHSGSLSSSEKDYLGASVTKMQGKVDDLKTQIEDWRNKSARDYTQGLATGQIGFNAEYDRFEQNKKACDAVFGKMEEEFHEIYKNELGGPVDFDPDSQDQSDPNSLKFWIARYKAR